MPCTTVWNSSFLRRAWPALAVLAMFAAPAAAEKPQKLLTVQEPSGEFPGWKSFHEQAGTRTGEVWRLNAEGVLSCRGTPKGYLYTEREYGNFVLRLEWRWPAGKAPGKGGVLIRITGPDRIWPKSLEAQINAGDAGDFWGLAGYPLTGPAERMKAVEHPQFGTLTNLKKTASLEKPAGEWNRYEILSDGDTVVLRLNGQEVNRATGCKPITGRICLTAEGNEIEFRNVEME